MFAVHSIAHQHCGDLTQKSPRCSAALKVSINAMCVRVQALHSASHCAPHVHLSVFEYDTCCAEMLCQTAHAVLTCDPVWVEVNAVEPDLLQRWCAMLRMRCSPTLC